MNTLRDRLFPLFRKHIWAIFFAFLVGALSVAPHILAMHALGNDYKGIPYLFSANEDYYLSRIHEIADGHYLVGSPYFLDYKDILPLIPPVGEYFYILLGVTLHISLLHALTLAKFLFPAILFFLVYTLTRLLSEDNDPVEATSLPWNAIAAGLFATLGYDLIDYHSIISRLLHGNSGLVLSLWVRPVNPITGALILFTFLILLIQSMRKNSWGYAVIAAMTLTFSVGYIFSFALGFVILGVLALFALIHKDWDKLKKIVAIGSIGLTLDAIYWWNAFPAVSGGRELAERNGMLFMHTPLLNKVLLAAMFVFFLLIFYAYRFRNINIVREYKTYYPLWFAASFLIGGFVTLNQQVLTGRAIWPYHFVQYTIPLAAIAVFVALFWVLRPSFARIYKSIIYVTILISITLGIANATTYTYEMHHFKVLQEYAPLFSWIDANTQNDCVILVAENKLEELTGLIPAFTHCNVYLTNYMSNTVPKDRITHDFYVKLFLQGVTADSVDAYLKNDSEIVQMYFYKDWLELLSYQKVPRIEALIPDLVLGYQDFAKQDMQIELEKYRIDYIISNGELASTVKAALPNLRMRYTTGSTTIYALQF